jgi:hypothetical protein
MECRDGPSHMDAEKPLSLGLNSLFLLTMMKSGPACVYLSLANGARNPQPLENLVRQIQSHHLENLESELPVIFPCSATLQHVHDFHFGSCKEACASLAEQATLKQHISWSLPLFFSYQVSRIHTQQTMSSDFSCQCGQIPRCLQR